MPDGRIWTTGRSEKQAKKGGISSRQVNYYCVDGRIPGAVKIAGVWLLPKEAEKPADRRYKSTRRKEGEMK